MKRWIIGIALLMLIGIVGTALRQIAIVAPSNAPVAELGATATVGDSKVLSPTVATIAGTTAISTAVAPDELSTAGQLVMIDHRLYPDHKLIRFDLATNEEQTLFNVPQNGWLYQLDGAPDGTQVAFSYAAPPGPEETGDRQPYDRSGIYLLSLEEPAATPVLLFGSRAANEHLFNPIWSPDGQSIYYVQYRRLTEEGDSVLDVALYRYDLATKESHFIMQDGVWPRVSPDGERLVYIQVDPVTTARSIHIADPDGGNVMELVDAGQFFDVDTPHFSADNQWIYFSAVSHSTKVSEKPNFQEKTRFLYSSHIPWLWLFGVKIAYAHTDHNIPADWWRVSVEGGKPEQITSMQRIISYGEFDDPGERLFFTTNTGVYSVDRDGDDLDRVSLPNLYRFFAWMP